MLLETALTYWKVTLLIRNWDWFLCASYCRHCLALRVQFCKQKFRRTPATPIPVRKGDSEGLPTTVSKSSNPEHHLEATIGELSALGFARQYGAVLEQLVLQQGCLGLQPCPLIMPSVPIVMPIPSEPHLRP